MEASVTNHNMVAFKPRKAGSRSGFTVWPFRVNFHKLLQLSDSPALFPQVETRDVLSVVVALFDVSFSELGPDEIYDIVSSPDSRTIVLLRGHTDVLEEYRGRGGATAAVRPGSKPPPAEAEAGDRAPERGRFCDVFSDSDSDDGSDEAGDSAGAAESREIGEKVLELSLLTTRRPYRKSGVGSYIVELLKSPVVCGSYKVLLAHAESNAVNFFTKCGLTDDPLLNDKFKEVRDEWTNTTLMSYLAPFSTDMHSRTPGLSLNLWEVELEVDLMRKKALSAYQQQAICVTRLVHEASALREQLSQQLREIKSLKIELELERKQRSKTEQRFLEYKLMMRQQLMERPGSGSDEQDYRVADDSGAESVDTTEEGSCRTEEGPEIRQPPLQ
ncbi:hypothetical protein COCON_G00110840 [Conger conger]|uniref:N-acetyltransferase domain-containing protein n=1 Tax=Conger conger TaxID=82655 RepID=A0A9Q1DJL8_CONCO|nr:hypothetical protein COCON_G00110840 [Conger conger]